MYRVRTQIFGSKIQDFSKTILYFSRLKVNKQVVYRDLENTGNQAFFMMHCKFTLTTVQCGHKRIMKLLILWLNVSAMGEIEWNLTTGKKLRLLTIFPDFISILKTFPRSEKLLGKFQDFQEFKTLYEPWCTFKSLPLPLGRKKYGVSGNLSTTWRQPPSPTSYPFELGAAGDIWLNPKRIVA